MTPKRLFFLLVLLPTVGLLTPGIGVGVEGDPPPPTAEPDERIPNLGLQDLGSTSRLTPLVDRIGTDYRALRRFHRIPTSVAAGQRLDEFLAKAQERLGAVDFSALEQDGRIDHLLLADFLEYRRQRIEFERERIGEIRDWIPFAETIVAFERDRIDMKRLDPKAAAGGVAAIAKTVNELRDSLKKEQKENGESGGGKGDGLSPVLARRAAGVVTSLSETLEHWYEYHAGYHPEATWWLSAPHGKAQKALEEYGKFLREEVAGIVEGKEEPLIGDPIGREALLADLENERIPYTPEELVSIAESELDWCLEEMRKAAREMGLGDDWKAALGEVKEQTVPPGEQDLLVRDVARQAIEFLDEHDLVTIPPLARETWTLEMISAEDQKLWPFAYYGGQHMAVAYPTDEMSHERKLEAMRGNNIHFTRNVAQHELIPGHHLQGFMAQRYRSYRRMFHTPFYGEGWALYWEMLLYDAGFPRGPEDRIGMLLWRMHRCARVIVSLRFHLGEMTPEEMVDFLVEEIGLEEDGATGEVRRYIKGDYSPLYQCAYLIGGIQFRALREELVESGPMSDREFHDAVLRQGPIPVELVRAALTGEELERDQDPEWRFVGDP
ncbi:MAG: DUF885 domain-containing protein [Thermoanaerobaculia bacterium]|nr:DUF885 domain-containing protein [Thermoanaerobaculia bacterium]